MAPYKSRCRNELASQFTQVFCTTHNLFLSQAISYQGLSIGMTSLVVLLLMVSLTVKYPFFFTTSLIFTGWSKCFGTHIAENHLGNLFILFFWLGMEPNNGPKIPIFGQNAVFCRFWAKKSIFVGKGIKLLVHSYQGTNETTLLCQKHWPVHCSCLRFHRVIFRNREILT